jgi:nucleoside permease NupC
VIIYKVIILFLVLKLENKRYAVQLVEEAILISVALVVLTLVMGGVESVLNKVSQMTSSLWETISKSIEDLFGFLWKW